MANITKPILLDETGKKIVDALNSLKNATTTIDITELSKQEIVTELKQYVDIKLGDIETLLSEI